MGTLQRGWTWRPPGKVNEGITNGQTLNNFSYKMSRTGRSIETEGSSATAKGGEEGRRGETA